MIVDASGKLVSTEIRKGLDEDARKKILGYLHPLLLILKKSFMVKSDGMLTAKDVCGIILSEKAYTESSIGGNKNETSFASRFGRNDKE